MSAAHDGSDAAVRSVVTYESLISYLRIVAGIVPGSAHLRVARISVFSSHLYLALSIISLMLLTESLLHALYHQHWSYCVLSCSVLLLLTFD